MKDIIHYKFLADDGSGSYERVRRGARGLLTKDGKWLLCHEYATGYYCIPGGGWEDGESLEETCVREMAEEMGVAARVVRKLAVVETLWEDMIYENHFFLCEYLGETETNLTERELQLDIRQEWVSFEEAKAVFTDPSIVERGWAWVACYKRDELILDLLEGKVDRDRLKRGERI